MHCDNYLQTIKEQAKRAVEDTEQKATEDLNELEKSSEVRLQNELQQMKEQLERDVEVVKEQAEVAIAEKESAAQQVLMAICISLFAEHGRLV